jgi:hypothetical protein
MIFKVVFATCLMLGTSLAIALEKPKSEQAEAKEVGGMSIVGNNETPKSLTIIPWKSSEIGQDTKFKSTLLSQEIVPVDKPTFLRELEFYKLSNSK